MKEERRLGLFGGTFDPVHNGHLQAADIARKSLGLDEVILIPSARPPHKNQGAVSHVRHRLAMLSSATAHIPHIWVSPAEARRDGSSYTIDTVRYFMDARRDCSRFFWLLGTDAFFEIHTWKSHRHLFDLIAFGVLARPGEENTPDFLLEKMHSWIFQKISRRYVRRDSDLVFTHETKKNIYLIFGNFTDLSSTEVRRRIREGRLVKGLLPQVAAYIHRQGLYRI